MWAKYVPSWVIAVERDHDQAIAAAFNNTICRQH